MLQATASLVRGLALSSMSYDTWRTSSLTTTTKKSKSLKNQKKSSASSQQRSTHQRATIEIYPDDEPASTIRYDVEDDFALLLEDGNSTISSISLASNQTTGSSIIEDDAQDEEQEMEEEATECLATPEKTDPVVSKRMAWLLRRWTALCVLATMEQIGHYFLPNSWLIRIAVFVSAAWAWHQKNSKLVSQMLEFVNNHFDEFHSKACRILLEKSTLLYQTVLRAVQESERRAQTKQKLERKRTARTPKKLELE